MPTWSLPLASESHQMALGVIGMVRFEVPDFSEILFLTFSYTNFRTNKIEKLQSKTRKIDKKFGEKLKKTFIHC